MGVGDLLHDSQILLESFFDQSVWINLIFRCTLADGPSAIVIQIDFGQ